MVLTNNGLNQLRDLLVGVATTKADRFSMGTSSTPELVTDTQLGAESAITRAAGAYTTQDKQALLTATVGTSDWTGINFREVGVFNAAAAGTMTMRQTFATVNKPASPSVTWRLDFALELGQ